MVDTVSQHELMLHIDNTQQLARHRNSAYAMLARKHASGTYDPALSPKAMRYVVDAGAKAYVREYCSSDTKAVDVFPVCVREALAKEYAAFFDSCVAQDCLGDLGNEAEETLLNARVRHWTLSDVRAANESAGFYFFSRDTMKAFGDTMRSFALRFIGGKIYLQRIKPMRDRDGRDMGGVGQLREFNPETGNIGVPVKIQESN